MVGSDCGVTTERVGVKGRNASGATTTAEFSAGFAATALFGAAEMSVSAAVQK